MKKILLCISFLCIMFTVVGCSEQEEAVTGEFLLGNFGFELLSNETYHLVVPFEWTGDSPVTIDSIELIKKDNNPITYEEDGIKYEFFGADPLKNQGFMEIEILEIKKD